MTKARTNASVAPATGRNMIINGAMNVAQRDDSVTGLGAASGYFTLDRYKFQIGATSAGRMTMSQTADGPNGISANCLKLDCTTADASIGAGEFLGIYQYIEGQNLQRIGKGVAGAQQIAVSFYVKANAAATYMLELEDNTNARTNGKLFTVTTDWVRQEIIFEADVDDGSSPFADNNVSGLTLAWYLHGGSNFTSGTLASGWANTVAANRLPGISSIFDATSRTLFITGVQLEVGPVATEFEQEDITTTTTKCQRYYQKQIATGSAFERFGNGFANTTGNFNTIIPMQVPMRATPAIETTGTVGNYGVYHANAVTAATGIAIDGNADGNGKQVGLNIADSNSGFTVGRSGMFIANNTAAAFIALSAEL